jgi:hypothetical protein
MNIIFIVLQYRVIVLHIRIAASNATFILGSLYTRHISGIFGHRQVYINFANTVSLYMLLLTRVNEMLILKIN